MPGRMNAPKNQNEHLSESVAEMFTFACWGLLILAPLTLVGMCFAWLNTGTWPEWTLVALGYQPPQTSMLGLNKAMLWAYQRQLVWLFLVSGFVLGWLVTAATQRLRAK